MAPMLYSGCICCYSAINMDKILVLCKGAGSFLCIESKGCCAAGETQFPVGLIKEDGAIIKCGLPCCTFAIKKPTVLCAGREHCLCLEGATSFPFDKEYVGAPVCAVCCFSCMPETGCMKPPPGGGAPEGEATVEAAAMER